MKRFIAGIAALVCVFGSMGISASFTGRQGGSQSAITAVAADEVITQGKLAGSYKYKYADTSVYTTTFTMKQVLKSDNTQFTWKSEDGNYTYNIYNIIVKSKTAQPADKPLVDECIIGIQKASENILDAKPSVKVEIPDTVKAFLEKQNIKLASNNVEYIADNAFANSYLKTIDLTGIKYIGASAFSMCQYITDITIPETAYFVGDNAFNGSGLKTLDIKCDMPVVPVGLCQSTQLTKISFAHPEMIRTIGKAAFKATPVDAPLFMSCYGSDVSKYETLTVDESAYEDCTSIKEVIVPDNVSVIGIKAFKGCKNASKLVCGKKLWGLDQESFMNCTSLDTIKFNTVLTAIGGSAFTNCTSLKEVTDIPNTIKDWRPTKESEPKTGNGLGSGVFSGCTSLVRCDLPESITIIPASTFEGCTSLTSAFGASGNAGKNIKAIGSSAFAKCTSLLEAKYENVIEIYPNAFSGCTALLDADFPSAVYIGGYGTGYMRNGYPSDEQNDPTKGLKTPIYDIVDVYVKISDDKKSLVEGEFEQGYNKNYPSLFKDPNGEPAITGGGSAFADCTALKTVNIPKSEYIFPNCFKGCKSMTTFKAGECKMVGNNALEGCEAMKEITLLSKQYGNAAPTKSNTTDGYIFKDCKGATKITISAQGTKLPNGLFSGCSSLKTIDGDISKVAIISPKAFEKCTALEAIDLPSARIIESDAFSGCTSLTKISSSGSAIKAEDYGPNAFLDCTALKVAVDGTISTIGNSAFKNSGITSVNLEGMTGGTVVIDTNAFASCANLKSATILSDSAAKFSIGNGIFMDCPELKEAVYEGKIITNSMFKNCPKLSSVITNALNIKENAFDGDKALTMVKDKADPKKSIIADEIANAAFKDCSALTTIPADTHTIFSGMNNFANCTSLKSVNVSYLTQSIFSGCTGLSDVKMTGITAIPVSAFANCTGLKSIDLSKILTVGSSAFSGSGLESVKIESAQNIDTGAFSSCSNLGSIDIVATNIGQTAFSKCEFLESATLNVDNIGTSAFDTCGSLRNVIIQNGDSHTLKSIGAGAFNNCSVLFELVVPGSPTMGATCAGMLNGKANPDFVLVGETGSTVQTYADTNKIEFKDISSFDLKSRQSKRNVPGDIDGNTVISVADAVKLQSWLLNKPTPGIIGANMDINGDKKVDTFDMVVMRKKIIQK